MTTPRNHPPGVPLGLAGWRDGCRCEVCTAAGAKWLRHYELAALRARKKTTGARR